MGGAPDGGGGRVVAAVLVEVSVLWGAHLLGLTPTFLPWLAPVLVVGGTLGGAVGALVASSVGGSGS